MVKVVVVVVVLVGMRVIPSPSVFFQKTQEQIDFSIMKFLAVLGS